MTQDETLNLIRDIFEEERRMILSGRLADLERMRGRKERALSALTSLRNPDGLKVAQVLAKRNAALLDAAAQGVRAALRRVREIRSQAGSFQTYSRDGEREVHATGPGALERRA